MIIPVSIDASATGRCFKLGVWTNESNCPIVFL